MPRPCAIRVDFLLCYGVEIATTRLEQNGCGPADAADEENTITPKQPKRVPRIGVHVNDDLGPLRLDTAGEVEVRVPATVP